MAANLIPANRQHVAQAQARGVCEHDVRGHEDGQRAVGSIARERFSRGNKVFYFLMAPCSDLRKNGLDPSDRAYTFITQQPFTQGCLSQRVQHSAMVVDGSRSEPLEGGCQIAIYLVHREVRHMPRQTLGQYPKLLGVARATPNTDDVVGSEVAQSHGGNSLEGNSYTRQEGAEKGVGAAGKTVKSWHAPLAQLDRKPFLSLLLGDWPIIRAVYTTALGAFIFFRFTGLALTLFVLGQFVEIAVAYRKELRMIRAPRRGLL